MINNIPFSIGRLARSGEGVLEHTRGWEACKECCRWSRPRRHEEEPDEGGAQSREEMPNGGARHWKCCSGDPFLYLFEAIAVPEQTKPIPDMLDLRRNLTRLGVIVGLALDFPAKFAANSGHPRPYWDHQLEAGNPSSASKPSFATVEARGRQNLAVKNLTRVGNSKKAATFRALDRPTWATSGHQTIAGQLLTSLRIAKDQTPPLQTRRFTGKRPQTPTKTLTSI